MKIRKPSYTPSVDASVDGAPVIPKEGRGYLQFEAVRAGSKITLNYALDERTTTERTMESPFEGEDKGRGSFAAVKADPSVFEEIQTTWRGNTVLTIDYDSNSAHPKHRLYLTRLERFREGAGRNATARFFLPDVPFVW